MKASVVDTYFGKIHWDIVCFLFSLFLLMAEAAILDDQFV